MTLRDSINQFYFDMTVNEIRQLHDNGGASTGSNLSYNSVMYLDIIAYQDLCTVSSLARTLRISKPAVTMKVNELAALGLVERVRSEQDKRVFYLRVSDEVGRVLRDYDRPLERAMGKIEREYTPEQIEHFCEILRVFSKELSEEASNGTQPVI